MSPILRKCRVAVRNGFTLKPEYDMGTFLDKAKTSRIEVQGESIPKQLHMYEVVQNRQKGAGEQDAEPVKPKRVELFLSKAHDSRVAALSSREPEVRKITSSITIGESWWGNTELSRSFMEQLYEQVRPIAIKLNENRQAQQKWAEQLSAQHAPNDSFLAVLAELAKAPGIRPSGRTAAKSLKPAQPAAAMPGEVEMALKIGPTDRLTR